MRAIRNAIVFNFITFAGILLSFMYFIDKRFHRYCIETLGELIDDKFDDLSKRGKAIFIGLSIPAFIPLILILLVDVGINNIITYFDMYKKLRLGDDRKPEFRTMEEAEICLRTLGKMDFVGIEDADKERLVNAQSNFDLLYEIFRCNYKYTTKRKSLRFNRLVKSGNSDERKATRRSIIDLFLIAITYKPEITLRETYTALAEVVEGDRNMIFGVCGDIHRGVYLKTNFNRATDQAITDQNSMLRGYIGKPINNRVDELDVCSVVTRREQLKPNTYKLTIAFYDQNEIENIGKTVAKISDSV